jgi:hypothetical protein
MGEDVSATMDYLKGAYKRSYRLWFESLYKGKYNYMGDAELMRISFLMDLATYFVGPVRLVYDHAQNPSGSACPMMVLRGISLPSSCLSTIAGWPLWQKNAWKKAPTGPGITAWI